MFFDLNCPEHFNLFSPFTSFFHFFDEEEATIIKLFIILKKKYDDVFPYIMIQIVLNKTLIYNLLHSYFYFLQNHEEEAIFF
jgi:hypothetical protein